MTCSVLPRTLIGRPSFEATLGHELGMADEDLIQTTSVLVGESGDHSQVGFLVDRRRQWSRVKNVRHSVAIRSALHMMKPGRQR